MANPARKKSDEGIESPSASQALNELFRRECQSRKDRVTIWWVSVGMVTVFLILVLLIIQDIISGPKNRNPTESTWYCHALPFFNILSRERPGSFLLPTCHTAVTVLPFSKR